MLREIANVTQNSTDTRRRWFSGSYFDLIVWYPLEGDTILGFQLCYDIRRDEHVFTWHSERGVAHNRIDSGEDSPVRNMTPILVPDGLFSRDTVAERFAEQSTGIDAEVRRFVLDKLHAYPLPSPDPQLPVDAGVAGGTADQGAEAAAAGADDGAATSRSTAQRSDDES